MTSKLERQRRRTIVRDLQQKELADELARMPVSREHLAALLQYLDAMAFKKLPDGTVRVTCDHTYRLTESFLAAFRLWSPAVQDWLSSYGGYCDCEVALNVGGHWEKHL